MTAHAARHEKNPVKPHFNFGSQCHVLKTQNFENVGLDGWESESSEIVGGVVKGLEHTLLKESWHFGAIVVKSDEVDL